MHSILLKQMLDATQPVNDHPLLGKIVTGIDYLHDSKRPLTEYCDDEDIDMQTIVNINIDDGLTYQLTNPADVKDDDQWFVDNVLTFKPPTVLDKQHKVLCVLTGDFGPVSGFESDVCTTTHLGIDRSHYHLISLLYSDGTMDTIVLRHYTKAFKVEAAEVKVKPKVMLTDVSAANKDLKMGWYVASLNALMNQSGKGLICLFTRERGKYVPCGWTPVAAATPFEDFRPDEPWEFLKDIASIAHSDLTVTPFKYNDTDMAWVTLKPLDPTRLRFYAPDWVNRKLLYRLEGCEDMFELY